MKNVAIKGRGGNDVQHKIWKGKILRIWITIIRHGGLGHEVQESWPYLSNATPWPYELSHEKNEFSLVGLTACQYVRSTRPRASFLETWVAKKLDKLQETVAQCDKAYIKANFFFLFCVATRNSLEQKG